MIEKITITLHENNRIQIKSKNPVHLDRFFQMMQSGILAFMNAYTENYPEQSREKGRQEVYDMYNQAASMTLELYAPEIEMRPHLTAQAILEAENRIINEGRAPSLLDELEK